MSPIKRSGTYLSLDLESLRHGELQLLLIQEIGQGLSFHIFLTHAQEHKFVGCIVAELTLRLSKDRITGSDLVICNDFIHLSAALLSA